MGVEDSEGSGRGPNPGAGRCAETGGKKPLRLSVDVSAVPADPVGAGRYTLELTRELATRADVELVVISRRSDTERWASVAPRAALAAAAPAARPLRLAWEQVRLARLLDDQAVAVHHGPHYTMPERSGIPTVVTVHDLSFFEAPAWHQRSKAVLFRRAIKVAARRASVLVCPSQATADELDRWCRVKAPVVVAHHGVDLGRFGPIEPSPGFDSAQLASLDPRLADGSPFLVFVGTLEPRKDVPTLVRAFDLVAGRYPEARLVLAGGPGWGSAQVDGAIRASKSGERIIRTGYVPDDTVPVLLRCSLAVVYPALYEGFGLPALEALACGAQLVTTSGSAMEEVAGPAAVLVAPGDVDQLSRALEAVLERSGPEPAMIQRGTEIAAVHTWAASADRHLEAYRLADRVHRG